MARPKSDDKRNAILAAAVRVVATEGLGAATAVIAKQAGVSNGSLFTYFETKAVLFNELYLELKAGMAFAAREGFDEEAELRSQVLLVWSNWMEWAVSNPDQRRALAQLDVSDEITPSSRMMGHKAMAGIGELLQRSRAKGPLREAPMPFVLAIMNSLAETTMDFMVRNPSDADKHCQYGFEALWRIIA